MKTALILACLIISLSLTATVPACYPNYKNGVSFAFECKGVATQYDNDECCMVTYIDTESNVYHVCYEFDAHMFVRFDEFKQKIKESIDYYYPTAPRTDIISYYTCSSNYLKMSLLALLLVLF